MPQLAIDAMNTKIVHPVSAVGVEIPDLLQNLQHTMWLDTYVCRRTLKLYIAKSLPTSTSVLFLRTQHYGSDRARWYGRLLLALLHL